MSGATIALSSSTAPSSRRVGRISGPRRFRRFQASRVRARSGPLRASWVANDDGMSGVHVAYAIPTSVGGAVERNLIRRRLRQIVAVGAGRLPDGDVLVRVSGPAAECSFATLERCVGELVDRLGASLQPAAGSQ